MQKSVQHLSVIGVHDRWETPKELIIKAIMEYGINPQLDVCTTKGAAKRHGFHYFFDRQANALNKEWKRDFFMNPPYSEIEQWMNKAWSQVLKHSVNGLILTYAKTDTKWWHKYVENNNAAEVHFIQGRIKFLINGRVPITIKEDGKKVKNSAPYPSCFIIFRSGL